MSKNKGHNKSQKGKSGYSHDDLAEISTETIKFFPKIADECGKEKYAESVKNTVHYSDLKTLQELLVKKKAVKSDSDGVVKQEGDKNVKSEAITDKVVAAVAS